MAYVSKSKSLATKNNLHRRHITHPTQCQRCCQAEETKLHVFFECTHAQRIWRASGISNHIIRLTTTTLEEKIEACRLCSYSSNLCHLQDLFVSLDMMENLEK